MTLVGQEGNTWVQPTEVAVTKATGGAVYGFACFRTGSWMLKVTALAWLMSGRLCWNTESASSLRSPLVNHSRFPLSSGPQSHRQGSAVVLI